MLTESSASDVDGLVPPGSQHSLRVYTRELWQRRAYLWHVPKNELASQQMNTVLGNFWHLLTPILSIAIYYLIFGLVLDIRRGVGNYVAFLGVGVFVFQYIQKTTMAGANSIVTNLGLIRSINFPRALLPLSSVVRESMAYVPALGVMLGTALVTGEPVRPSWALLPVLFVLQMLFTAGTAFAAARATHTVRDVKNVLPFVFRLLFYASGVIFSVDAYVSDEQLRWLFELNPVYDALVLNRWAVLGGAFPGVELLSFSIWAFVALIAGFVWFHRDEAFYGASN